MARPDWYDTPRGMPSTVPGNSGAASLRAAQGFNAAPGVSGHTAPMAPAEPVNLRGGSGVNPTMPVATAPAVPAEPAPKVGMGRAIANTLRTGAGYVGAGLKASTPMAIGAAAGAIQNKIDASAPEQVPFVPPAATAAGIPIDPNGPRGPAKIERHPLGFGPDNVFTRNLANTMNALPGTGPAMNVLRGGSAAAKLLTAGENTARVGAQVVRGAQATPGYVPPEREGMFPATQPANPTTLTDAQRGGAATNTLSAAPGPGNILRQGNSYSGSDIGFGATINGMPSGRGGLIKNQPNNEDGSPSTLRGGGTVSSMDMSEGRRQDQLALQRIAAERVSAPQQGPVNHGDLSGSWRADTERKKRESSFKNDISSIMNGNMKPRDKRAAMALLYEQYNTERKLESGETVAKMGDATSLRNNAANNATARRSNDQNNQTSLRGQDMELEGRMAPTRLAESRRQLAGAYTAKFSDPAVAAQAALMRGDTDVAEHLFKGVSTMQAQAEAGDKLTGNKRAEIATGVKGAFNHLDKEGQPKMSEALEAQAVARIMRSNPDFHQIRDPAKRQQVLDDALGDEELMTKFGKPSNGGFADLVPNFLSNNKPMLRQDNIPNAELFKNGQIGGAIGGLRGALTPFADKGDRFYDPGPGHEAVNMGDLSARALRRLEHHRSAAQGQK